MKIEYQVWCAYPQSDGIMLSTPDFKNDEKIVQDYADHYPEYNFFVIKIVRLETTDIW